MIPEKKPDENIVTVERAKIGGMVYHPRHGYGAVVMIGTQRLTVAFDRVRVTAKAENFRWLGPDGERGAREK